MYVISECDLLRVSPKLTKSLVAIFVGQLFKLNRILRSRFARSSVTFSSGSFHCYTIIQ